MARAADKVAGVILTRWVAYFGEHDIIIADKGPMCTGAEVRQFRTDRDIAIQKVIPGHRQSLGEDERRNSYFRDIAQQIKDRQKQKKADTLAAR